MLSLEFLVERSNFVMDVMLEYSERVGFVGVVFSLGPVEPGRSVGVAYVEGSLLPDSKVLVSK